MDLMFLDTVQLSVPLCHKLRDGKYLFSDSSAWSFRKARWGYSYLFNKELRQKIEEYSCEYIPTVSYCCRVQDNHLRYELKIEFSVPKLLYFQNFRPVPANALDEVFVHLASALSGVYGFLWIDENVLKQATLSRMDCSAVTLFDSQVALDHALDRIEMVDLNSLISIDRPSFSSDAHGVIVECNSWQFCFYDKSKEYKNGLKKMSENSYLPNDDIDAETDEYNRHILTGVVKHEEKGAFSFLPDDIMNEHKAGHRYMQCELRLNTKDKIRRALKRIGLEPRALTLVDAINDRIPHKILQYHWQMILDGEPRLDIKENSMLDISTELMKANLKPRKLKEAIGHVYLLKEFNTEKLKVYFKESHGRNSWKRLKDSAPALPGLQVGKEPVQPITDVICGFPVRISNDVTTTTNKDIYPAINSSSGSITITLCTKNIFPCSPTPSFLPLSIMPFRYFLSRSRAPP